MIDDEEIDVLEKKKNRRDLLETLKMFYPGCATFEMLGLTMPTVEKDHMNTDLSYLMDKKFVEWINQRPNMARRKREYRLTALGVETADRINKDPALEF